MKSATLVNYISRSLKDKKERWTNDGCIRQAGHYTNWAMTAGYDGRPEAAMHFLEQARQIFQYILDKDREAEQGENPTATQDLLGESTDGDFGENTAAEHPLLGVHPFVGDDVFMTDQESVDPDPLRIPNVAAAPAAPEGDGDPTQVPAQE